MVSTLTLQQQNSWYEAEEFLSVAISIHFGEKEHILPILCQGLTTSTDNMHTLPYTCFNFNLLLHFIFTFRSLYIFVYCILHLNICLINVIHTFRILNTRTILICVNFYTI
jgi:hypothetical protein